MTAKDGRTLWILDKCQLTISEDGIEYLDCVLIDITQIKQAQEELRLTMERHQIIMDQTADIIFEWNIAKNTLDYSSNWFKKFGYQPITENIDTQIPLASHILPEDISRFVQLMQDMRGGKPYGEAELRIANAKGQYIWCKIRATTQFDRSGMPIKAVGVILDIDNEKRRTQELIEKAEHDSLTGMYNKGSARNKIQRLLETRKQNETFAMMIIDMDNFKQVNDTRGHMFGDAVLAEIALQLKNLFRPGDIVARIGGDEFLVFMQEAKRNLILNRAQKIIDTFHTVFEEELQKDVYKRQAGGNMLRKALLLTKVA